MSDLLSSLFGGKTKASILDVLLSHPDSTYHLRGLAQAAGADSGNTSRLLQKLVDHDIVLALPGEPSTRYAINLRSPVVGPLRELVACAGAFMHDLRVVAQRLDAVYVGVFGSFAAGTGDVASDVDLLIVGDLSTVAAQAALKATGRKHDKVLNALVVTAESLPKLLAAGGAFWSSVSAGKRIDLKGSWDDVA